MVKKEIQKFEFIKKKPFVIEDDFVERLWGSASEMSHQSWEESRRRSNDFLNNDFNEFKTNGVNNYRFKTNGVNNYRLDQITRDSGTKLNQHQTWVESRRYDDVSSIRRTLW